MKSFKIEIESNPLINNDFTAKLLLGCQTFIITSTEKKLFKWYKITPEELNYNLIMKIYNEQILNSELIIEQKFIKKFSSNKKYSVIEEDGYYKITEASSKRVVNVIALNVKPSKFNITKRTFESLFKKQEQKEKEAKEGFQKLLLQRKLDIQ